MKYYNYTYLYFVSGYRLNFKLIGETIVLLQGFIAAMTRQ